MSDHRRELAVLQTPPFILRQNPPSTANSPMNPSASSSTPTTSFLNGNFAFDSHYPHTQEQYQLSPPLRPGTAPSSGDRNDRSSDGYFPSDDRRPSVASVITNASSTGSKSSIGRQIMKKFFGDGDNNDSPASSESSLPPSATPRSHFGRPTTPTYSRPRTPVPSSDVVPFLYQDLEDVRRLGDAPVHEAPIQIDDRRLDQGEQSSTSSHSHRFIHRSKNRDKDRDKGLDKELPQRPSSAHKESLSFSGLGHDHRKGHRIHLDGTASSHSSQTRLIRPGSPTPSVASSQSNNPPRSPSENTQSKKHFLWGSIFGKSKDDKDDSSQSTRSKGSKGKSSEPITVSASGISPVHVTPKRGPATCEYVNPRTLDYASVEMVQQARRKGGTGIPGVRASKRGASYEGPDSRGGLGANRHRPRGAKDIGKQPTQFTLDTDLSNIHEFVKPTGALSAEPGPGTSSSWENQEKTPPVGTEITWEPPESWDSGNRNEIINEKLALEEEGGGDVSEDTQYCIRVFRADSTFATLSCRLQASVTEVLHLLGRKSFLQDDLKNYQIVMKKNGLLRILGPNERPLKIQKRVLEQAGYTEDDHLEEIGREDHGYLCRFTFMMSRNGGYYLQDQDQDPGLGKMQKFSHVDLQGRNLLAIPITLYHKAPEIISLNLSRNLSLNIPTDFIQQCVNLRKIEFQGNEVERLPSSISAASRLTYLDVSNNRLSELDNASLENHASLVALKMANNRLRALPECFSKFKSLRSLNLSSNFLTCLPTFICELVTLVDLDISFNMIKSFPLEIGQLSALERLTATNNLLSGPLTQTFSMLGSLKELDVRYNKLHDIDIVADLPRLELVIANNNAVTCFQYSFPKLRALHLNTNPVTRFNLVSAMPMLKLLNLSEAKLAALAETLFEKLPNLEKLVLDMNHIVSFPPQIGLLKKLEYMSCFNNDLALLPKEIGQLQELKFLDLHANNLKVLPGEIWQLMNLRTLNVSSNLLKELPKPITNHTAVPTSSPPVDNLSPAKEKTKEEDGAKISEIRRPSQTSGGLLSVAGSPGEGGRKGSVASVYTNATRKASVISKTGSENGTTSSQPRKDSAASSRIYNTFAFSLRYLYLADNKLSDEVFEQLSLLSELRVLNLSYNEIYDIPSRALKGMPLLNELYLSGNELTSLPAEDLESVNLLNVLYINSNKFYTLPAELGKIRKLLVLDVGNNSLKYNISNWPYDWNWNWNLELKYLSMSGNKRLEIKPGRNDSNSERHHAITDFTQLSKLRVLGLMDVTLTIPNVPDQTEDRRIRLSGSMVRSMSYGMADSLGRSEHLSMIDMVIPGFRGNRNECIVGMFDGQALSTGGSKVSKFLHESLEFFLKEELDKLRADEKPGKALHRAFLNLNKELATVAMQTFDEKNVSGINTHRGSIAPSAAVLGQDDLASGGVATVVYIKDNELYLANVGDAMAILVQTNGDHKLLTKKHDPGNPLEAERIREAGGYVSRNGKLNDSLDVSRAFGYIHLMPCVNASPHIHETTISDQEDFLIIASREVWEYLSYQTAVDLARSEREDLMKAAHKLRDIAMAYGATNKIMVMILGVGDLKKAKLRTRTQSVSVRPGQGFPNDEQPQTAVIARKRRGKTEIPDDSGLARLDAEVRPPEGDLAMVFTDIKNSTLLWETYPIAMRSGIKIHNNIMRRQLRIVGGYEVKTEGDAFMVCFPTATSALLWCFSVQSMLLDADWPSEILESIHGKEVLDEEGNQIYRGLSVRMGIHWGGPVCETDPITRRMDYFGPIVNRASRISAEADGGQITVSSDFVAEINRCVAAYENSDSQSLSPDDIFGDEEVARAISRELRTLGSQGFEIKELGSRKLKGLENPEFIHLMYPQSLRGRLTNKRAAPKPEMSMLPLELEQIWALWEISLRLETLCSTLSNNKVPTGSTDIPNKLRSNGEKISEDAAVPFLEHIITRIENSMTTLHLRKLLTPDPSVSWLSSGLPLTDLLTLLESRLSSNLNEGTSSSSSRITEVPYVSPHYADSAPSSPHS
ncbi:phosphatase 2C-domain-containing protein [Morchella snyderi]|nr:phosphatase 2C-domain-containing protein [Morchella snyderi]